MPNNSIWHLDRTLSDATTWRQSWPGSDDNERVFRIAQSSGITGASLSDCLVSYQEYTLGESYASAEMQSMYLTAPAEWAI